MEMYRIPKHSTHLHLDKDIYTMGLQISRRFQYRDYRKFDHEHHHDHLYHVQQENAFE